jgi:aspartate 1-decarboxylase
MPTVTLLKSKIHRATVTDANLEYEGSVSICPKLIEAAKLLIHEKVDIYNCNNGERFSTYVIKGKEGEICLNGAAARKVQRGDLVIIASYAGMPDTEAFDFKPSVVMVTSRNEVKHLHRP